MIYKRMSLVILSTLIALQLLMGMSSTAFASTKLAIVSRASFTRPTSGEHSSSHNATSSRSHPRNHFHNGSGQVNNQYDLNFDKNSGNRSFKGKNQGNGGNLGYNQGLNQDNGGNDGNQVVNRHRIRGYQENNQYFEGHRNNDRNSYYQGSFQGNGGNLGYNKGSNQDNGGNAGNQVIN